MSQYQKYSNAIKGSRFPLAYLDMDLIDKNIDIIKQRAGNKLIRIASKSIRSVEVLKYIKKELGDQYNGVMCFSAEEALWLCEKGFDNLLIAYPCMDERSIREISRYTAEGKSIYLMVDSIEHIDFLRGLEFEGKLKLCLDIDLSTYLPGLNFGVFRSPLRTIKGVKVLVQGISKIENLELKAVMGYEAQVAGVTDNQKGRFLMNLFIGFLKRFSLGRIKKLREDLVRTVLDSKVSLDFVNGGGTGSMESTKLEPCVTEIAVGSGFYCPTLFDSYKNFRQFAAAGFALEIVRIPKPGVYTCFAGGYVASGAVGKDKAPQIQFPVGSSFSSNEMAGEVQTPVFYKGSEKLTFGSPIFFRHSKAGELCERFNEITLLRNNEIEKLVATYRGDGKCFG